MASTPADRTGQVGGIAKVEPIRIARRGDACRLSNASAGLMSAYQDGFAVQASVIVVTYCQ